MEERKKIVVIEDDKEIISLLNRIGKIEGYPVKTIFYEKNIGNILKEILAENPKLCLCDGLNGDFSELYEKLTKADPYYTDKNNFKLISSDKEFREKAIFMNIAAYDKGGLKVYNKAVRDSEK